MPRRGYADLDTANHGGFDGDPTCSQLTGVATRPGPAQLPVASLKRHWQQSTASTAERSQDMASKTASTAEREANEPCHNSLKAKREKNIFVSITQWARFFQLE